MSLVTDFKKAVAAATKAAAAQDYSTAIVQARAARIALMGIPTSELAQEKIEYSRDDLESMIADLRRAQSEQESSNTGLVSETPIYYTRH
jgi:sRNA-binding protein